MGKRFFLSIALGAVLLGLGGCDSFNLLEQFDLFGGLSLNPSQSTLQPEQTTQLNPAGGTPPYTYAILAEDLVYTDGGDASTLGLLSGDSYTAKSSLGKIRIRLTDSTGASVSKTLTIIPPAPNLSATSSSNTITLSWTPSAVPGVTGIEVWKSENGGAYALQETLATGSSWTDSSLNTNRSYSYLLYAVAGPYSSPASNTAGFSAPW